MQIRDKLAQLVLNDEGFMFDPTTGDSFVVNQMAVTILQRFQDGQNETEIAHELVEHYNVSLPDAARDIADFISRLKSMQLM